MHTEKQPTSNEILETLIQLHPKYKKQLTTIQEQLENPLVLYCQNYVHDALQENYHLFDPKSPEDYETLRDDCTDFVVNNDYIIDTDVIDMCIKTYLESYAMHTDDDFEHEEGENELLYSDTHVLSYIQNQFHLNPIPPSVHQLIYERKFLTYKELCNACNISYH